MTDEELARAMGEAICAYILQTGNMNIEVELTDPEENTVQIAITARMLT